jgi:hypothetical protein
MTTRKYAMTSVTWQRRRVFSHDKRGHDLAHKDEGTDYRRLYVDKDRDEISVGKSDEFDTKESGIFCFTCDRYLASSEVVDEW